MKKKGAFLISIIFLLALMPSAFSIYKEPIYSETVEDRDTVNISNTLFEFRIDPVSSKVFIEIDVSAVIIASGECKTKGNFDICIGNVSFSYRNVTEWRDVYKATVDVYQIKSTLDITNTIEQNNLLIDEETTAELAVENTADVVAKDVTAAITIPSSVLVTDIEGCKKTLETIVFKEDIYPGQIRRCTYKIEALDPDNFELKANVTYFDGVETINIASDAVDVKIYNQSLQIKSKQNKSKFNILEKFDFTVDIENINDQYDLRITTLSIKLPEKLLLLKRPKGTSGNNNLISWSGTLEAGGKTSLVAQLQSLRTSNYSIPISASYEISKFLKTAENNPTIEIYCDCPYISHDFSQQITVPEQRVTLKAFITNPSPVLDFRNVKINYITNIPNIQNFSTTYASIKPSGIIKIFDSPIITPPLDEIYYLNITAIYESSGNQIFVVEDKIAIKVPEVEEETTDAEEAEVEEQRESEEVSLISEKPEEEIDESQEKEISEEIPITTLQDEGKKPIKALTVMAYIAAIIFILIILLIFKRKKHEKAKEQKDTKDSDVAEERKQIIKEALSNIFKGMKENMKWKSSDNKKEDLDYKQLEREIQSLGKLSKKK
jgi:hypothetical protein